MRKKCKRKVHVANPYSALLRIGLLQPLSERQRDALGMEIHMSLERMRIGHGVEQDFHDLAGMVNSSMVLAERGFGEQYGDIVEKAKSALLRVLDRGNRTKRWAFDGDGYKALTDACALYEEQLSHVTREEAASATEEVYRRMLKGNVLNKLPVKKEE